MNKGIDGQTRVYGIFGFPVAHSLSPLMQNQAFRELGINAVYLPFPVPPERLGEAVSGLRALNLGGVNVTIPHKERVGPLLDEVTSEARLIGAVNTLVHMDGKLTGHNTDAPGFLRALQEELDFDPQGKRILVLGAGGACRAVVAGLSLKGAAWIGIADLLPERARRIIEDFAVTFYGTLFAGIKSDPLTLSALLPTVDLLVNATPVGMKGEGFQGYEWRLLPGHAAVFDLVYSTAGTPLVQTLRELGYRGADGLGMLAAQGEEAFFLWTGKRPPPGLMKNSLKNLLQR
ncbi:MAG: shikimate dehydrogenase [Deltaproteobacteria bacterium]|nr:shikimate dehydrogenase [Deltaproteobacteria bacterium]